MKIKGDKKPNDLIGTAEDDKIIGLGGDDNITAKGGHDDVDAGSGDDKITISADTGASVDAGKGNDTVKVSAGALASSINLGKGDDTVDIKDSSQAGQAFSIAGGDGNDTVNFALDQVSYTVTENGDEGYTVTDANGNTYTISSISTLTFNGALYQEPGNPINEAPVVSSPLADQTASENAPFSFQFASNAFTDPDNDVLTYTATLADGGALPSWLAFDAATRTFTGTPPSDGAFSVMVTASDGNGGTVSDVFSLTVADTTNYPPTVANPIADQSTDEGEAFTFQIPANTFADANGTPLTYTVSLAGGGALPSWLTFNAATRTLSGTPDHATAGTLAITVSASDGVFGASDTFDLTINDVPTFLERWQAADADYVAISAQTGGVPALFGNYGNSTSYGNTTLGAAALEVNMEFLQLAEDYIAYLTSGGEALTDILVKVSTGRSQSLHDNILGNVSLGSLTDRHLGAEAGRFGEWTNRAWVSGYTDAAGTVATLKGVAFDFAHDVNRDDYHSFDATASDATLSDDQTDPDGTLLNNGTPGEHFHVTTFNAAGITMGLAAHKFGSVYTNYVNGGQYTVEDGRSSINVNRADWSFAMSVQDGLNGSTLDIGNATTDGDYDVGIWIDTNYGGAQNMVFIGNLEEIADSVTSNTDVFQNSWNIDFGFIKSLLEPSYTDDYVGTATFGIELRLTEVGSGSVVMTNHIDVLVA